MRILFSYEGLLPTSQADAEVFLNTASAIARRGHDATLLAPRATSVDALGAREVFAYYDLETPLRIEFAETRARNVVAQHLLHALKVALDARAERADLVYTRHLGVLAACLSRGLPTAFEHYRPWGDQFPPLQGVLRRLMGNPNFLGMVVHSRYSMRAYRRIGIPEDRLAVVHNGFEPRRIEPRLHKWEARRRLGLPRDAKIAVYAGRMNEKKGLDVVLAMARRRSEVFFVLVGSERRGPVEDAALRLPNVRVVPWQAYTSIAPYLYAADVLVVPPSKAPLSRHGNTVLPLKLFSYLAAGRPILGPDNPDLRELLRSGDNALLVPPGEIELATEALDRLLTDDALSARIGRRARALGDRLTWDARAERIEAFLEARLGARGGALEPWDVGGCLAESGAWLRGGLSRGRWVHAPDRGDFDTEARTRSR